MRPESRGGTLATNLMARLKSYGMSIGAEKVWCAGRGERMSEWLGAIGGEYLEHLYEFKL